MQGHGTPPLPANTNINICEYINYMLLKMQEWCNWCSVGNTKSRRNNLLHVLALPAEPAPKLETRAAGYWDNTQDGTSVPGWWSWCDAAAVMARRPIISQTQEPGRCCCCRVSRYIINIIFQLFPVHCAGTVPTLPPGSGSPRYQTLLALLLVIDGQAVRR